MRGMSTIFRFSGLFGLGLLVILLSVSGCSISKDCVEQCTDDGCIEQCKSKVSVTGVTVQSTHSSAPGPVDADQDDDGIPDALESTTNTSPYLWDTDGDGLSDGEEDPDGDGFDNLDEVLAGTDPADGNDYPVPHVVDTDGDGLTDAYEVEHGCDPYSADTDGDGFLDGDEIGYGTDPVDPDSDDDGVLDGDEIVCGSSPLDPNVVCEAHAENASGEPCEQASSGA